MNLRLSLLLVAIGMLVPDIAAAQEESNPHVLASYWICDMTRESRADEITRENMGPVYQKHVDAGHLTAWGWLAHDTGGMWRRANYYIAPDRDQLMAMRGAIVDELLNEQTETTMEFLSICPRHVDYIWESRAGSAASAGAGDERATAAISTYYVCDVAQEERADELVNDVFAPILDRHVEAGNIASWSWLAHDVGGEYRRLFVMDGADHASILNGRDMIGADMASEAEAASKEFGAICNSHADYLWDVQVSSTAGE